MSIEEKIDYLKSVYYEFSSTENNNINEYLKRLEEDVEDWEGYHDSADDELIEIGTIRPIQDTKFLEWFMDWWVNIQDEALDRVEEFSDDYADLLAQRGVTFDEFRWVMSGRATEEDYLEDRAFQYLYITDKRTYNYFIATNSKTHDEEGILETFQNTIQKVTSSEDTILSKFFFNSKVKKYLSRRRLKRHLYIPAGSGSGKSEIIKYLFHTLQKDPKLNVNLIEPHMDLSLEVLRFTLNQKNKERVVYLDPFIRETAKLLLGEDIFEHDYTFVINPFDLRSNDEKLINAMTNELSSVFFTLLKSEATEQMEVLIESCIETLLRESIKRKKAYTIEDLKRFMAADENSDLVTKGRKLKNTVRRAIIDKLDSEKTFKSTRSGIYLRLTKLIGDSDFRRLLVGDSTVDVGKCINTGKVVICNFSEALMSGVSSSAMGKFYISLLQGHAVKRALIPKKLRPTSFTFVDECQEFLTPTLKKILTGARKYNFYMILANQYIGQDMDNQMKRTILANTGVKIAGVMDSTSVEAISREMGTITPKDFQQLEPYQFYMYDNNLREQGTRKIKIPDYLVNVKPPFYMDKKALKDFLLYMVHESGYYVKVDSEHTRLRNERTSTSPTTGLKIDKIYNPNFKD